MPKRNGNTVFFDSPPTVQSFAAIVGKKEGDGPLGQYFDAVYEDTTLGQSSWEKAESMMQRDCAGKAIEKAGICQSDIQYMLAGDLLNQCISSTYGLRDMSIPYVGLFGACSTMAESLALSSMLVDGQFAKNCLCVTSSHFCSAERQFRFPLEYGGQRTPTSQWTATASGSAIISTSSNNGPYIKAATMGTIEDYGIKDMSNMGAAMAPSAAETIKHFLTDSSLSPNDFDLIVTGDLGFHGSSLLVELLQREDIDISSVHNDCGMMLFDVETQNVGAGASGCGCSAAVICSYILSQIQSDSLRNVLFAGTGSLMSPTSMMQGETIPCVTHAVHFCSSK